MEISDIPIGVIKYDIKTYFILQLLTLNPFKAEFTIVIFIHYKPRTAVAILDL